MDKEASKPNTSTPQALLSPSFISPPKIKVDVEKGLPPKKETILKCYVGTSTTELTGILVEKTVMLPLNPSTVAHMMKFTANDDRRKRKENRKSGDIEMRNQIRCSGETTETVKNKASEYTDSAAQKAKEAKDTTAQKAGDEYTGVIGVYNCQGAAWSNVEKKNILLKNNFVSCQLQSPRIDQHVDFSSKKLSEPLLPVRGANEPLILKNKAPRWHEQLQCWCLNFRGCVTIASVKNFQLVAAVEPSHNVTQEEQEKVILQFGKIGKDIFTMDYCYPLSAFQAFAICLSSFDTKPTCE
ncbi:hypothetical protein IFM89_039436 [Coptis chinensis]|uniref:Tubby C-terminal domain-containing protein n=1 Tax=Coptis chinensis TaxID=261450 RepID=A0A835LUP8_9MAGN|nr:hypothetical protein IFM89_039436 [Coptis chinensis]